MNSEKIFNRPNVDAWALSLVKATALRSTCFRRNVACVLLDTRNHVIATGYNGVASGQPHCNERTGFNFVYENGIDKTKQLTGQSTGVIAHYGNACSGANAASGTNLEGCQAIHAEQNALLQCKNVYSISTAYVSTSPCITCVKLLMNTSCNKVVFLEEYPHPEAKKLWESKPGRIWQHYKEELSA
jgi:dCMP deaminase